MYMASMRCVGLCEACVGQNGVCVSLCETSVMPVWGV